MTELNTNPLHLLEERNRERLKKEGENRSKALFTAALCFTAQGLEQLAYEFRLRTVRFDQESDPIMQPLLGFFNRYFNGAWERIRINLEDLRLVERAFFEACSPRIQLRDATGFPNPVSLIQRQADLYGKPLDKYQREGAMALLLNTFEFHPSTSMLLERHS